MSLHYFIDGYNLIWSADNFGGGPLQSQRERLLRFLEIARPAGSAVNQVMVVFDGREDVDSPPWRGSVRVVFSKGENADAVIKRNVDAMANGRNAVVVTDDREIQRWVRASKARVMSCGDFLKEALRKKASRGSPNNVATKSTLDAIDQINEEFRRLWQKD